jgi:hypothetical protein
MSFARLDLDDAIPHHSTFSENRLNRFRESDILERPELVPGPQTSGGLSATGQVIPTNGHACK